MSSIRRGLPRLIRLALALGSMAQLATGARAADLLTPDEHPDRDRPVAGR